MGLGFVNEVTRRVGLEGVDCLADEFDIACAVVRPNRETENFGGQLLGNGEKLRF